MVTGGHPFPAGASMEQRLTQTPPPPSSRNPALDPMWDCVILRCLHPDPSKRFNSAEHLLEHLAPRTHRHISIWAAGLAAAALLIVYVSRPEAPSASPPARLAVLPLHTTGCENGPIAGALYDVS